MVYIFPLLTYFLLSYILSALVPFHLPSKLPLTFGCLRFDLLFLREAWDYQRRREKEEERGRGPHFCHSAVLRLKGPLAGLITVWAALWRSAASLSERRQTLFPFICCGHSWGKVFKGKRNVSSLLWSSVCVCITLRTGFGFSPGSVRWILTPLH